MPDDETTETTPTGPHEQTGADPGLLTDAGENAEQTGEQQSEPAARGKGGRGAWAAVAALCVVLGAIASVLGAHAVARNDTSSTRTAFAQSSKAIATSVKFAIQRQ
jgi:uncharacterized protein HemX